MLDRANIQPGDLFADSLVKGFAKQMEATIQATSFEDLMTRVAQSGQLIRFSEDVWPTMYRCATVTQAELEQLRRIRGVVRRGHVQKIEPDKIVLDQGDIETNSNTLHIDCTADGLERRPVVPVFDDDTITLQSVRTCQQVFSAAFIAHVEAAYDDEAVKNELCVPVPHPDTDVDFLRTSLANSQNSLRWARDEELQQWLLNARLDGFSQPGMLDAMPEDSRQAMAEMRDQATQASIENLKKLLSEMED
jgi:hypothetical protein